MAPSATSWTTGASLSAFRSTASIAAAAAAFPPAWKSWTE